MKQIIYSFLTLGLGSTGCLYTANTLTYAQVVPVPDGTLNTQVNTNGSVSEITGGETRGSNLFHSFQDFSVGTGNEAFFKNADSISNIFSRVTGGNTSNIDGLIRANGSASLFLINPNGIMFGKNASLDIGGSFIGSTADSLLFPDGIEFSATDLQTPPILTINAPIGLGFRDDPGAIVNPTFDEESYLELEVAADKTLALIGGEISINGGSLYTEGGRIELGSVGENSSVSLTEVEKGWDVGYEGVENFRDINLSGGAYVESSGENTGDIQVRGRSITLVEGSQIGINTTSGQAGNLEIIASESLKLEETASDPDSTFIFSDVLDDATGADSQLTIETDRLEIKGGQIGADALGSGKGVNVEIKASEIEIEAITEEVPALIFAYGGSGDGGNLTVETGKLTANQGAQINASTFGAGNAGNLLVNATESIELIGTVPDSNKPSGLVANVEEATIAGNGGDIAINTPRLILRDGAQIATAARNQGNGGTITINADESILLTGTSPLAEFPGKGRSTIAVSAEPSFIDKEDNSVVTSANGGRLELNTPELIIERGAQISADTRSLGNGGEVDLDVDRLILRDGGQIAAGSLIGVDTIDTARGNGGSIEIDATESVTVSGTGKIGEDTVNSSIFTKAESNGTAGNLSITTNNLRVRDDGEINTSASGSGAAGNLSITADSLDLNRGTLTAATAAGRGGNIKLMIDDRINLRNNSRISANASKDASGGNVSIDSKFIIAFPSQTLEDGSDIIAKADQGKGGNITITASILGIQERDESEGNGTNDINASSARGAQFDGNIVIDAPDPNIVRSDRDLPKTLIQTSQTSAQACRSDRQLAAQNSFTIKGKGGVPPAPELALNSANLLINGESINSTIAIPQPIATSQGKIQPARGIKLTEDGQVILTAYRTNNQGERLFSGSINCGMSHLQN